MTSYEGGNLTPVTFCLSTLSSSPYGPATPNHFPDSGLPFLMIAPRYANLRSALGPLHAKEGCAFSVRNALLLDEIHACFPQRVHAIAAQGTFNVEIRCILGVCPMVPSPPALTIDQVIAEGHLAAADLTAVDDEFPNMATVLQNMDVSQEPPNRLPRTVPENQVMPRTPSRRVMNDVHSDSEGTLVSRNTSTPNRIPHATEVGVGLERRLAIITETYPNSPILATTSNDTALRMHDPGPVRTSEPEIHQQRPVQPIDREEPFAPSEDWDILVWQNDVFKLVCREFPPASDQFMGPRIQAPTVGAAAEALMFLLMWHFNPASRKEEGFESAFTSTITSGAICPYIPLELLLADQNVGFKVGDGIGSGPRQAVLRAALQLATDEGALWTACGAYKTINFHSSKDGGLAERETALKACGFLSFLHLLLLEVGPEPVSPFLLHAALDGRASLKVDKAFIDALDPDTFKKRPSGDDFAGMLMMADINITCLQVNQLLTEERDGLERSLAGRMLIGTDDPTTHPDFLAFRAGFNYLFDKYPTVSINTAYYGPANAFLGAVYNRRIKNVDVFIVDHITFEDDSDATPSQRALEELFQRRMSHYLRGSGHPIHPALEGVISPERYHAEEGDAALRATLLLQTMTASPLQPVGESWKLMFAFAHAHQDASLGARPEVIQMYSSPASKELSLLWMLHSTTSFWSQSPQR
ncbi:hypothetical protein C2E23DRAFT_881239 [Lenzites betulinus]|nr:hypothetical protein C2E23DRAFT_881239 [Lenzites betulinus]